MNSFELQLCDIQGRLFVLSGRKDFSSIPFITCFMMSHVAEGLDAVYNRMQWAGEEYLLEETTEGMGLEKNGKIFSEETLYWTGYIYRYWHFLTGESSKMILQQASPNTMNVNYLMFHTMAPELAIEDLKEIYEQKKHSLV